VERKFPLWVEVYTHNLTADTPSKDLLGEYPAIRGPLLFAEESEGLGERVIIQSCNLVPSGSE